MRAASQGEGVCMNGCCSAMPLMLLTTTTACRKSLCNKYALAQGTEWQELAVHALCGPCAIAQEARELRLRNGYASANWGAQGF